MEYLFQKKKFEKLVKLVGFIIRTYHDARSSECQILRDCAYIVTHYSLSMDEGCFMTQK
jgi:hypothetical protein